VLTQGLIAFTDANMNTTWIVQRKS